MKYLYLPEHFTRSKKDIFASIVGRIPQKAISWFTKILSFAGKMIMLKSVLSAMPSHSMFCFKLPQSFCANIQSTLTRFRWNSDPTKSKTAWISWKKMIKPKKSRRIEFKDTTSVNDALLAKIC